MVGRLWENLTATTEGKCKTTASKLQTSRSACAECTQQFKKERSADRPQVVGVGRLQQVLRARALLLLEKDVVLGVAVGADGALFTAGAADGFALQLHRQGDALDVVCERREGNEEAKKSKA